MYIVSIESTLAVSEPSRRSTRTSSLQAPSVRSPPRSDDTSPKPNDEAPTQAQVSIGYLGYTAYCSVYEEAETMLMGSTLGSAIPGSPGLESAAAVARSISPKLSPTTLDTCLKILSSVPDPATGIKCFWPSERLMDSFPYSVAKRILYSFYDTFGRYLGRNRNALQLEFVAQRLHRNTARRFSDAEQDPELWVAQLLGQNLRWESVGILLTYLGPKTDACEPLRCVLDICSELSCASSPLVYLYHKYTNAESVCSGDASESLLPRTYNQLS